MPELSAFQCFGLTVTVPIAVAGIATWILDGLTTEPDTDRAQLHHLPKAEYVRYVEGYDVEAIQRSVQAQRPVVPPSQHQRAPYPYRRN